MRLLELIGEAVPAVTGALLMLNEGEEVGEEFGSTFAWNSKRARAKRRE